MIEVDHLVKTFTRQVDKKKKEEFNAVDDMSFVINDGELVGILGPNGAGKTTLLRMLATLMTPTSGTIRVVSGMGAGSTVESDGQGIDVVYGADSSSDQKHDTSVEVRKHIGYLSANTKLYDRFSVRETMKLFGETYGMSDSDIRLRTSYLIEVLNMASFVDNRIAKLSTGQMQRAQIARCLIHDPDIYIFDEPTLGLDVISSRSIIEFMKDEKQRGKTILYSTHYMEEAQYLCDRLLLLEKGRIVCEDTPAHLMESTGSDTMRDAFFATIGEAAEWRQE